MKQKCLHVKREGGKIIAFQFREYRWAFGQPLSVKKKQYWIIFELMEHKRCENKKILLLRINAF